MSNRMASSNQQTYQKILPNNDLLFSPDQSILSPKITNLNNLSENQSKFDRDNIDKTIMRKNTKKQSRIMLSAYEKYIKTSKLIGTEDQTMFGSMNGQNQVNSNFYTMGVVQINNQTVNHNQNQQENYKKNYFIIITYVQRFIKSLLLQTAKKDINVLQLFQLHMINDRSADELTVCNHSKTEPTANILYNRKKIQEQKNNYSKLQNKKISIIERSQIISYIVKLFQGFKVFQPNTGWMISWESILLILVILQLIIIPIKACFNANFDSDLWMLLLYQLPIVCFSIDIYIGFHTGFYEFGVAVMDKKQIFHNYMKSKFWIDLSCTFILILNLQFQSAYLDSLALIIRLHQIGNKAQKINQHFQFQFKFAVFYDLTSLIVLILFIAHLCGCGFHLVQEKSLEWNLATNSWVIEQKLTHSSWQIRYVYAFYFTIITMITIGYGDVNPVNVYEMIYVSIMAIFSCGVFAYCVNTIGQIFTEINQKSKHFQTKLYDISTYMNMKAIKKDIQIRILKQLEYQEDQSDEILLKGESILKECSLELREEFLKEYFGKMLQNIPILRDNYSSELIEQISLKMSEKLYGPGEIFIAQGQIVDSLFVVTQGIVEYSMQGKESQRALLQISKENKLIGFKQFLTSENSEITIQCKTVTTIAFISFEDFFQIIKSLDQDYEKFCMMRDQFKQDGRFDMKCGSCGQYGHDIDNCGQLHYCINRSTFSRKIFYNHIQEKREGVKRKIQQKLNTFQVNQQMKIELKMYRWQKVQELHSDYSNMNVVYEMSINEKDKDFFRRCPKIKQNKIKKMDQQNQQEKNVLFQMYSKNLTKSICFNQNGDTNECFQMETQYDQDKLNDNLDSSSDSSQSSQSSSSSSNSSSDSDQSNKSFSKKQKQREVYDQQNKNTSQESIKEQTCNSTSQKKNYYQQVEIKLDSNEELQNEDPKNYDQGEEQQSEEEEESKYKNQCDVKASLQHSKTPVQNAYYQKQPSIDAITQLTDKNNRYSINQDSIQNVPLTAQGMQKPNTPTSSTLNRNISMTSQSSSKSKQFQKNQNLIFHPRNHSNSLNSNNNQNLSNPFIANLPQISNEEELIQNLSQKTGLTSDNNQNSSISKKVEKKIDKSPNINFIDSQNSKKKQKLIPPALQTQINNKSHSNRQDLIQINLIESFFEDFRKSFLGYSNKVPQQQQSNIQTVYNQQEKSQPLIAKRINKDIFQSNSIGSKEDSGINQQQNDTNSFTQGSINRVRGDSNLNQNNQEGQINGNNQIEAHPNNNQDAITVENYRYKQNGDHNNHIFGKLNFKLDKMKEFQIYYPRFNAQSIIKSYKKMQYQIYQRSKPRKAKQLQNSSQQLSAGVSPNIYRKTLKMLQSQFKDNKALLSPQVDHTFSY